MLIKNNYIIAKCIQYAGYCLKDLYLFIKRTKIALCPHHAQSLAMKSLAGLWEEGEKAFSADAATDLPRVTAATHPTLQLRVVSPQHRTPQKAKGEKALEGHKTDCRFVLILWSIPTPIHSEDHRQLTENRGGRCVEMLALKIKARHGAVIWGLRGKRTRDSSCLRGRIKIDQTAEN